MALLSTKIPPFHGTHRNMVMPGVSAKGSACSYTSSRPEAQPVLQTACAMQQAQRASACVISPISYANREVNQPNSRRRWRFSPQQSWLRGMERKTGPPVPLAVFLNTRAAKGGIRKCSSRVRVSLTTLPLLLFISSSETQTILKGQK